MPGGRKQCCIARGFEGIDDDLGLRHLAGGLILNKVTFLR